ncbi:hypothetical protein DFH09DRAFT_1079205 [Mycena vulgaris]|nr:hypothetical protein DFH09DRAFT_1079205 [Mycena vulgaris]
MLCVDSAPCEARLVANELERNCKVPAQDLRVDPESSPSPKKNALIATSGRGRVDIGVQVDIEFAAAARNWVINIAVLGVVGRGDCVDRGRREGRAARARDEIGVDLVLVLVVIVPGRANEGSARLGGRFEWECELGVASESFDRGGRNRDPGRAKPAEMPKSLLHCVERIRRGLGALSKGWQRRRRALRCGPAWERASVEFGFGFETSPRLFSFESRTRRLDTYLLNHSGTSTAAINASAFAIEQPQNQLGERKYLCERVEVGGFQGLEGKNKLCILVLSSVVQARRSSKSKAEIKPRCGGEAFGGKAGRAKIREPSNWDGGSPLEVGFEVRGYGSVWRVTSQGCGQASGYARVSGSLEPGLQAAAKSDDGEEEAKAESEHPNMDPPKRGVLAQRPSTATV